MLNAIIYWNSNQLFNKVDELTKEGFAFNMQNRFFTKNNSPKIMAISHVGIRYKLSGYNFDQINFLYLPDREELALALDRLRAKKGKLFVMGEEQ